MMDMSRHFLLVILHAAVFLVLLVNSQDQSGFISIDCGMPESSYKDETTGIHYVSDATYIDTGVSMNISSEYKTEHLEKQYWNVRSFPEGTKNCYTIKPTQGRNNKYLIRVGFMYGNYDEKEQLPTFELYLGANWWTQVILDGPFNITIREIIHFSLSDNIYICLVNIEFGTPFISFLELRPLANDTYVAESGSLELFSRLDCGSSADQIVRFPEDVYDRIWSAFNYEDWIQTSTSLIIDSLDGDDYRLPSKVMETAVTPVNNSIVLEFYWLRDDPTSEFYLYLHFAEIQELKPNQSREFNVCLNGDFWHGPVVPKYLRRTTIDSKSALKGTEFHVSLNETNSSNVLPLINAAEIYLVRQFSQSETNQEDVDAIINIKSNYKLKRHWQGDPCFPEDHIWDGLNCSYNGSDPPRIISLNLSSSGLTGEISSYIFNLKMIKYLDLSNNSLTGSVPNFLSELPFLRVLNLQKNQLSGFVPERLIERSKNRTLLLSVGKNRNLCASETCNKKRRFIIPSVVSIGAIFIILLTAVAIIRSKKRRKQGIILDANAWKANAEGNRKSVALEPEGRQFSYSEVLNITNNLDKTLGKGELGTTYYGRLDDATQVIVKMFSQSFVQVYNKQFQAKAKVLMGIHHPNLATIVGYCDDGTNQGLICEFVPNQSLERHLSDRNTSFLNWEERLQIAIGAAQGLEHLHHGNKTPIIHGNLKSANVLLNQHFPAKLADFGFSTVLPAVGYTDSTEDVTTTGSLDPEFYVSKRLNEKSDVYSFGIVLMEIISSRPVIDKTQDKTHISQWISSMLAKGDIGNIVDPRLKGDFHINSVWKAIDTAMACITQTSAKRPSMKYIVMELNEGLAIERARKKESHETESKDSIEMVSVNLYNDSIPLAR